jgi:RNA polymerase sigma-70 factor (TIGR02960 family)
MPAPSSLGEVPWLQPFPDLLLDKLPDRNPGPDAQYETREAITLAFITAMQKLSPRQRAVLILRDVLGYPAVETAGLVDATVDSVNSALKRARAALRDLNRPSTDVLMAGSVEDKRLIGRFVTAFVNFDVDAIVELMSEDVWVKMPPAPLEYHGRTAVRHFFAALAERRRNTTVLVPISANAQPAWGEYRADPLTGLLHLTGIEVVAVRGGQISELIRFDGTIAPWFGLPRTMNP